MLRGPFLVCLLWSDNRSVFAQAEGPNLDADLQQMMDQYPNAYHPLTLTVKLERQPFRRLRLENRHP